MRHIQIIYKSIIPFGLVLFITALYLDGSVCAPLVLVSVWLAEILILLGIVLWFRHFYLVYGQYPSLKKLKENINWSGSEFYLDSHFLLTYFKEWTVFVFTFGLTMLLFFTSISQNQPTLLKAKEHCLNDEKVLSLTGGIKGFGFFFSQRQIDEDNDKVVLKIYGKNKSITAHVYIKNEHSGLTVTNMYTQ